MRASRSLSQLAIARKRVARLNEIARAVRAELSSDGRRFEHRDTESVTERAWQNEPTELHIGFRAD